MGLELPPKLTQNPFTIYTDKGVHRYYPKVEICGSNKNLQKDIRDEVGNIYKNETKFIETTSVPTVNDSDLTFPRHDTRQGKTINTCVLFVDIRDSVKKNEDHRTETLVRMYSSFVYGVLSISKEYHGHPRNIIGDRVMIVFDEENCCDNAIKCAGAIMYFCQTSMSKVSTQLLFKHSNK